jgi:tetratricopeptide (TPR) repeat protein
MKSLGFIDGLLGALNGLKPPFCYHQQSMWQNTFCSKRNSKGGRAFAGFGASSFAVSVSMLSLFSAFVSFFVCAFVCAFSLDLGFAGAALAQQTDNTADKPNEKPDIKTSTAPSSEQTGKQAPAETAQNGVKQPDTAPAETSPKVLLKPGQALTIDTGFEDIVCTNDVELARKQREAFPDNAEASFIYAVALSRTFKVEQALKEVRRARGLAEKEGGPAYFNKMISTYENMLTYCPTDNQVRYHLAWAYYMKAYLLARYDKQDKTHPSYKEWIKTLKEDPAPDPTKDPAAANATAARVKRTIEMASPKAIPQIQNYYKLALEKLDQILASNPTDVWARIYRAHLAYEAGGKLDESIAEWLSVKDANPTNPAPYFFLGEGFLKQGNLKESLKNVSQAVALRSEKREVSDNKEVSEKKDISDNKELKEKAETAAKPAAIEEQNKAKDGGQ